MEANPRSIPPMDRGRVSRLGKRTAEYLLAIEDVAPHFARVNVEFAFGDINGKEKVEAGPSPFRRSLWRWRT